MIYLEGGGDSKELHVRCREGFRKLLESCGFQGRMPRLVACGNRNSAFGDFAVAHNGRAADFIAMLIDSEHLVSDVEETWRHLQLHDQWMHLTGADNEQVLFMTTCMETWLISDRTALRDYFGGRLQDSALPPLEGLETRDRHDVQGKLVHATRDCLNAYVKGKRSFELLGKLAPDTLRLYLPSFFRIYRILNKRL
jgi:hypothetical protein